MVYYKNQRFLVFMILIVSVPFSIFGDISISFSTGYGLPLPFEYAGNTFNNQSSYKEIWSSFGNGLKLNLQTHLTKSSNISIICGVDGTVLGSCVLPKVSDTFQYHDKYSQTLGGLYLGIETFGGFGRWVISASLEPGIYYPYRVTVVRQHRFNDQYFNGFPNGDVISDTYRCYYYHSFGLSSSLRLLYKVSQSYFVFFSIRPSIIHARIKGYVQNINGEETYYEVGNGGMKPFPYTLDSEIREKFPMDFSSIAFSIGFEYPSWKH